MHRIFLGGQAVSLLGDGCAALAVPLLVLNLTGDPLLAALAAAPRGVGYLLVGLPAGPLVDRLNPWTVLIAADVVRAGVFVALPLLGAADLWTVLALAFLAGAATVFFDAALTVAVRDLFAADGLVRANSVLETAAQTAHVVGPALVGVLAATLGTTTALALNAATFLVSLATLLPTARKAPRVPRPQATNLARDFLKGLRFLAGFRPLLALTAIQALVNLALAVDTLFVYFARTTLQLNAATVGAVTAGIGVGGVIGALLAPWFAARVPPLRLIAAGVVVVGAAVAAMGLAPTWPWFLAAGGVQAAAVVLVSVVNRATRQAWVPRDLLGRVSTTVRAVFLTATPVGAAVAGLATRAAGGDPRPVFLGAGLLVVAVMAAGWTVLRRYDGPVIASGRAGI